MSRNLQTIILLIAVFAGLGGIYLLSAQMDNRRAQYQAPTDDEDLYISPERLKTMSGDFRGLVADWYWINSLQYLGRKIVGHQGTINTKDMSNLDPKLLYPMLDRVTTLDPTYMTAYTFGAVMLPAINEDDAIRFIEKGIADNPDKWVLYQHLGYIYWQRKDYQKASEVYDEGSRIPNAPAFLKQMSGKVLIEGGSNETAREIYQHIYDTAEDQQTKDLVYGRLLQIESLEERDAMNAVLTKFRERTGRCAASWREIGNELSRIKLPNGKSLRADATNTPVDPLDAPYMLKNTDGLCEITLDFRTTKIPPG